jgi:hypothetical protein
MTPTNIKTCIACGMFFVLVAESAIPSHECPARRFTCEIAGLPPDNPHGPENDHRPTRPNMPGQELVASMSSTGSSYGATFTSPNLQRLNELALRIKRKG